MAEKERQASKTDKKDRVRQAINSAIWNVFRARIPLVPLPYGGYRGQMCVKSSGYKGRIRRGATRRSRDDNDRKRY